MNKNRQERKRRTIYFMTSGYGFNLRHISLYNLSSVCPYLFVNVITTTYRVITLHLSVRQSLSACPFVDIRQIVHPHLSVCLTIYTHVPACRSIGLSLSAHLANISASIRLSLNAHLAIYPHRSVSHLMHIWQYIRINPSLT